MSNSTRRRKFSVDALFADTSPRAAGVSDLVEAKVIQLDRIVADPDQPRKEFDPDALGELAMSIRSDGVLQPIAVRYDAERDVYVILHGERRWRAAREAGIESIPAVVRDVPSDRRLLQQLVENIIREDLNALDRAAALRALKVQMGDASWDRVAEAVGIRRSRLFQLLGTEKLSDSMQEALRRGIVSEKQTRAVQSLPEVEQERLGTQVLEGSLDPRALGSGAAKRVSQASRPAGEQTVHTIQRQVNALHASLADLRRVANIDSDIATRVASNLQTLQRDIDATLTEMGIDS